MATGIGSPPKKCKLYGFNDKGRPLFKFLSFSNKPITKLKIYFRASKYYWFNCLFQLKPCSKTQGEGTQGLHKYSLTKEINNTAQQSVTFLKFLVNIGAIIPFSTSAKICL